MPQASLETLGYGVQEKGKPEASPGSSAKHDYSPEERKEAVDRIMALSEYQYPEILAFFGRNDTPKPKEVTGAYRKMVLLVHPDKCEEPNATAAFQRVKDACDNLKGDVGLGWFHKGAQGDEDNGPDLPRPQEESPPAPDDFHKTIYSEATPDMLNLIKDPTNANFEAEIIKHNKKIVDYNKDSLKKQNANREDNIINLSSLVPNYELIANLFKKPWTRESAATFKTLNNTLSQLNTRYGYPSTWIAEAPPERPQDTKNLSDPGKGKSAADQARGRGAAAEPYDPDPSFRGVRTRYNEPILGWKKVGRDGRQYLVQTGSPEYQAFELRSQAGDDGVGRRVGRLYEASPNAMQLGVIDKEITKDHADRYVEVTGVAYKPLQVVPANSSDRFPVTVARVVFKNPAEVHWVFRTTLRRVAGKRDADLDIHDWSKKHGFVTSLEAPPRRFLIENPEYANAFPGRASVLPGRARALIRADDEDEALPEKEIKTLTDGQEELRTRLDKLEKETKDQHKSLSDQMADMQKNITEQIAALIAKAVADMMSAQKAQTS